MDYKDILIVLVVVIVIVSIVYLSDDNECFVNDYYDWNWNNPNMMTIINNIDYSTKCPTNICTYSMSCDYTDDAHPWCINSLDDTSYLSENDMLISNSF